MTSGPEAMCWGFEDLKKKKTVSWDLDLDEGSWFSGAHRGQTSSLRRDAARGEVRWKSQHRKKLCLSLLMSENFKLKKVNKSFVPEPKKRVVSVSYISGFPMYISYIRTLVVFWTIIYYNNAVEATKNISCARGEDTVDHFTVTRGLKKFCSGRNNLDDQAKSVQPKPVGSKFGKSSEYTRRVSGEIDISQSSVVRHFLTSAKTSRVTELYLKYRKTFDSSEYCKVIWFSKFLPSI